MFNEWLSPSLPSSGECPADALCRRSLRSETEKSSGLRAPASSTESTEANTQASFYQLYRSATSDLFVSIRKYQCTPCTHIPKVTNVIQTSETQYLDSLTRVAVSHLGCVCDGMRQQMTAGEQKNRAGQNQVTHHLCWRFKVQAWGLLSTVNGWSLILYTPLCQS